MYVGVCLLKMMTFYHKIIPWYYESHDNFAQPGQVVFSATLPFLARAGSHKLKLQFLIYFAEYLASIASQGHTQRQSDSLFI